MKLIIELEISETHLNEDHYHEMGFDLKGCCNGQGCPCQGGYDVEGDPINIDSDIESISTLEELEEVLSDYGLSNYKMATKWD